MKTQLGLAMDRAGIKGADIRRALDVGEAMVSRWRTGKMYVPPKHRECLADLLGMKSEDLFDELGRPKVVINE